MSTLKELVAEAKELYEKNFGPETSPPVVAAAPGRVNLIGEHTDYTGGFVLPFAIDFSTVVYGYGTLADAPSENGGQTISLRFLSKKSPDKVEEFSVTPSSQPPTETSWTNYVIGTVFQYIPDLPATKNLSMTFAISGNVPLGSGLSSSASLEVSVARFLEEILGDFAFSSADPSDPPAKTRALRCQKAENQFCFSPCGIMDQYVSSAAVAAALLLIDCNSLEYQLTKMAETDMPVLVVTNSNVQHDIAGGEYPVRVAQCKTATEALVKVNDRIHKLRDATVNDVEKAKDLMDVISYKRAKHVVTENSRTLDAKEALEKGNWVRVGELMNASHSSMRDDYEVSCDEIDVLVDLAQKYTGVYGSRLTGGGFGGCTVTLVKKNAAPGLIAHIKEAYKAKTGKDCFCFETLPSTGAHLVDIKDL
jgi:galactokinase